MKSRKHRHGNRKRTRKYITTREHDDMVDHVDKIMSGELIKMKNEAERNYELQIAKLKAEAAAAAERKKKDACSKFGKCNIQGGSLMSGGSILQQSFGDGDTSTGALDKATNQQKAAGEEALRIRNEENQTGGFVSDFMPHPSMTSDQAQTQKGIADTFQQGQANAEFDNLVPKANKCLRNQAGAGRKSIFSKIKKSLNKKKRTKSHLKKKRRKSKKRKTKRSKKSKKRKTRRMYGGKSRKRRRRMPVYRFSQRPPLKV